MNSAARRPRWWVLPATLTAPLLAVQLSAAPAAAQEPTPGQSITFHVIGGAQPWVVPPDVHQATFIVEGAQGGDSELRYGANGGRATVTMPVTPGETLLITVGDSGQEWETGGCAQAGSDDYSTGGFNGGGSGGGSQGCIGAGGGGASDVRRGGSDLANRVIVAGGGGGAGADCDAGGGGGLTGGSGACDGGAGGDQNGSTGSGQLGVGGEGGNDSDIGAGGGGGYWGGAGSGDSRPGGGGSGFGPADTSFETGVKGGRGQVTISFGADPPTVTAVTPNFGPARGGADTVITGTNLEGASGVYFGSAQADPKTVSCTATECHAAAPPGADAVNVRVEVAGQISLETPADDYSYLGDPTIKTVSPGSGGEGTVITIDGTDFFPAPYQTEVSFGSDAVPAACPTPTQCTVPSPPGLGPVDGVVVTPQGRTASFPFTRLPAVNTLTPRNGPTSGNTLVHITGSGFDTRPGRTLVEFGVTPALAIGCSSSTKCIAVSPPGSGLALVSVNVGGWESLPGDENYFGYGGDDAPATPADPVDVRFGEDSDALDADDEAFLQAVLVAMQGAPASTLSVEGHADSTGPDDYNDDLALRRAQAVTDWLVAGGLAADRITTVSHGEHMPVASNDTADGRAINRRVTLTITPG